MQSPDHAEIQWYSLMYYKLLNNICYSQIQSQPVSRVMLGQVVLTYAIPFPITVWHGMKDVLFGFNAKDTIPVCPGNTLTLFVAVNGIEI